VRYRAFAPAQSTPVNAPGLTTQAISDIFYFFFNSLNRIGICTTTQG